MNVFCLVYKPDPGEPPIPDIAVLAVYDSLEHANVGKQHFIDDQGYDGQWLFIQEFTVQS